MHLPWKPRWKPVSVLTGFLGSGKTTILQHLLKDSSMSRTALIINEFGEVSVDHLLVETAEEKMVLLSNGCVCCSVRGDLVGAIRALFKRQQSDEIPPFDRILLETTGLADPAPIVQSLIGPALSSYPVYFDSVATTVDATNVVEALPEHPQMRMQIAVADSLLVTKEDLVSEQRMLDVHNKIRELNQRATPESCTQGRTSSDRLFGQRLLDPTASPREMRETVSKLLNEQKSFLGDGSTLHNDGIRSFTVIRDEALDFGVLQRFLRALTSYQANDLLRVKGLVKLRGSEKSPYVVHGVQAVMHPPTKLRRWPTSDRRTRLVFITRNIAPIDIENMLQGIARGFG